MTYIEPHMKDSLKDHVLERVLDTERFKAFYLKRPGDGRMMSTLIVFTPEGIVIMGDLCPTQNGAISTCGRLYGVGWFAGHLSEEYLCEKFLHKKWQQEVAEEELAEYVKQEEEDAKEWPDEKHYTDRPWKKVQEQWTMQGVYQSDQELYDAMNDVKLDTADGVPGFDYPRSDAGWLCTLQQRFAELYAGMTAKVS